MKHAVLVGAGHAHLHIIREAAAFSGRGHALTVIAPGPFWYSGLATGMLGGRYPPELDCIDVAALATRGGARLIADEIVGLDRPARRVVLRKSGPLAYDVLSLNLGSAPPVLPGDDQPGCYSVKPIARLRDLRRDLEARFAAGESPKIVIAGAGATGCELAGNVAGLAATNGAVVSITVLAGGGVLRQLPDKAAVWARANLQRRGVSFQEKSRVVRLDNGSAVLADGGSVGFDLFLNASGLRPAPILKQLGLQLSRGGALALTGELHATCDPAIFGGGDCAAVAGRDLPRIGVYAIRQAPMLLGNLLATLEGTSLKSFVPQGNYLWIMNMGDGSGLAMRGAWWWRGRSAFWLKDVIDRRFLSGYRA